MSQLVFRCSSLGKIMTEPKSIDPSLLVGDLLTLHKSRPSNDEDKAHKEAKLKPLRDRTLSEGAKTYIRQIAAQDIFGVEFEVSSKQMEKGIAVEDESIELLNRVRGLNLRKNTERKTNGWITGEADLVNAPVRGHDLKSSWSVATFPISVADCLDELYAWQMRGYMLLWDVEEWEVNYALVDTPEKLIGYEPIQLHAVSHIPEHMRLTTWTIKRDRSLEALMRTKVEAARIYYAEVIREFDRTHTIGDVVAPVSAPSNPTPKPQAAAITSELPEHA